jgi:hypothetical protein
MTQYTRSAGVVDAMAEYSNLLGLLIGLESISYGSSTNGMIKSYPRALDSRPN